MTSSRPAAKPTTTTATTKPFVTQITQHMPTTTLRAPTNQPDHGMLSVIYSKGIVANNGHWYITRPRSLGCLMISRLAFYDLFMNRN